MTTHKQAVYSHGSHESALNVHKLRTVANSAAYLVPHLKPGMKILDVGCGPGTISVDLARYVPGGHVTGLEYDPAIVEHARAHAAARGAANVAFVQGNAHALPFADGSFDVVHAHQVLQHVADPVQALREMRRVTRRGGLVACREAEMHAMVLYPPSDAVAALTRVFARLVEDTTACDQRAGRKLHAWARAAGFSPDEVKSSSSMWMFRTPEEREF